MKNTVLKKYMAQSLHIGLCWPFANLPLGICAIYFVLLEASQEAESTAQGAANGPPAFEVGTGRTMVMFVGKFFFSRLVRKNGSFVFFEERVN